MSKSATNSAKLFIKTIITEYMNSLIENNVVSIIGDLQEIGSIWESEYLEKIIEVMDMKKFKVKKNKKMSGWNIFQKEMRPKAIENLKENGEDEITFVMITKELSRMWKTDEEQKKEYNIKAAKNNNVETEEKNESKEEPPKRVRKGKKKETNETEEENESKEEPPKRVRKGKKKETKETEVENESKEEPPKRIRKGKKNETNDIDEIEVENESKEEPPKRVRKGKKKETNEK